MQFRSQALLGFVAALTLMAAEKPDPARVMFEAAKKKEVIDGDLKAAIEQYKTIVSKYASQRAVAADALIHMAECYQKLGDAQSSRIFDQVLREYGDQKDAVTIARAHVGGGPARESTDKIWTGTSSVNFFRPSPDGRYLVGWARGLVLHDLSSNTDRQLTSDDSQVPCFTPDRRRIVYERSGTQVGRHEIRIINVDGTGERTIFSSSEYQGMEISAITADGKTASVGLNRADKTWQVGLISLDTGKLSILKNNEWRDMYVGNFSPDGRWLVYQAQVSKEDTNSGAVYAVATDGSAQFTLTAAASGFPFFTPDGSRVVFVVKRPDRTDLWSVRVADGKLVGTPEIATTDVGEVMGFAGDGSFYYKKSTIHGSIQVAEVDPATWKLKSAPQKVSNSFLHENAMSPAWSPDGKVLAYLADNGGPEIKNVIVLHRFDGTPDREMSAYNGFISPGWSPDGKSLVGMGYSAADNRYGLHLFDLETQSERTILDVPGGLNNSATDGKAVFYSTWDSGPFQGNLVPTDTARLFRHDLQTREERELYHTEAWNGLISDLALSPDGRSLTFTRHDLPDGKSKSLWLLPVSGGEPRKLPSVEAACWTQDSKALLFVRSDEIWVQPVDGREAYGTGIRFNGIGVISVHPDGSRIAFKERTGRVTQVSAIRNLFSKTSAAK